MATKFSTVQSLEGNLSSLKMVTLHKCQSFPYISHKRDVDVRQTACWIWLPNLQTFNVLSPKRLNHISWMNDMDDNITFPLKNNCPTEQRQTI